MALSRLERKAGSKPNAGKKPFLSEYVEEHETCIGFNFEVTSVRETNSRAGYLLETDEFICCLFKSNDQVDELLELVEACYSQYHCGIYVIVDEEEPSGFSLAYDIEVKRTWARTKKFPGGYRYTHAQTGRKSRKPPRNLSAP
jgi:hypothetical protein